MGKMLPNNGTAGFSADDAARPARGGRRAQFRAGRPCRDRDAERFGFGLGGTDDLRLRLKAFAGMVPRFVVADWRETNHGI